MRTIRRYQWMTAIGLSIFISVFVFKSDGYASEPKNASSDGYASEAKNAASDGYVSEPKNAASDGYASAPKNAASDGYAMDYSDIDAVIAEITGSSDISFSELVGQMTSGQIGFSLKEILKWGLDKITASMQDSRHIMIQIIVIAIIGAIFTNFSEAFSKKYVSETGFYLTYMMMFLLLAASFAISAEIAVTVVDRLLALMKVVVPAFCTAVTLALGIATSQAWYQLLMMLIVAADWVMAKFLIRFIKIYVILSMVNEMLQEDYFSKMSALFQTIIGWSLRTVLGITLGMNLIQSMVLPAFDSVKNGVMSKVTAAIPGVGDALGVAAKTVIGSGVLLKNAVGTAGVVIVCVVCAWPLIQLLTAVFMYKLMEALIQPISDKRLVACVHAVGEGVMMLLKACGIVILLFVLSLAMMTSMSNVALQ